MISKIYVLTKNEEKNIARSLNAIVNQNIPVVVLDSGSVDSTEKIVKGFNIEFRSYNYVNHCNTYNELTLAQGTNEWIVILDADMIISNLVIAEINEYIKANPDTEIIKAPINMYWEGQELKYSSLCPAKGICFKCGNSYFLPLGHGESIKEDCKVAVLNNTIIHDDRKLIDQVLLNQIRYARQLKQRSISGQLNGRDAWRVKCPLFIFLTPLYSYIFKGGFLDGKVGIIYALDRILAETIAYRTAISLLEDIEQQRNNR
jgi:glycosyltransferase involved in cell wall biosynthesis